MTRDPRIGIDMPQLLQQHSAHSHSENEIHFMRMDLGSCRRQGQGSLHGRKECSIRFDLMNYLFTGVNQS